MVCIMLITFTFLECWYPLRQYQGETSPGNEMSRQYFPREWKSRQRDNKLPCMLCQRRQCCFWIASISCPQNTRVFLICNCVLYQALPPPLNDLRLLRYDSEPLLLPPMSTATLSLTICCSEL